MCQLEVNAMKTVKATENVRGCFFCGVMRKDLTDKKTCERRHEGNESHADICGKGIPGREEAISAMALRWSVCRTAKRPMQLECSG